MNATTNRTAHSLDRAGVADLRCDTHRFALQGLRGDCRSRGAGRDGPPVEWVPVLRGRRMSMTLTGEGESPFQTF